jgi:hypothetical protein
MSRSRYAEWRGGDDPLAPPYDVSDALDQLGDSILDGLSPAEAFRALTRRGLSGRRGLEDLMRDVRNRQREARQAGRLDGTLERVRELLDQALDAERRALFPDPGDDARLAEAELDALPQQTARAVRSHRIDSPNVATTIATGRPNACNLCHLDRSLAWTARWLTQWYGVGAPVIADEERAHTAVGVRDGLAGDAGVRALIADALGSNEALAASGSDFEVAVLEELRRDPYPAVRRIAERSLRRLGANVTPEGLHGAEVDRGDTKRTPSSNDAKLSMGVPSSGTATSGTASSGIPSDGIPSCGIASRIASTGMTRPRNVEKRSPEELAALALGPDGRIDAARLRALLAARDQRAITIAE